MPNEASNESDQFYQRIGRKDNSSITGDCGTVHRVGMGRNDIFADKLYCQPVLIPPIQDSSTHKSSVLARHTFLSRNDRTSGKRPPVFQTWLTHCIQGNDITLHVMLITLHVMLNKNVGTALKAFIGPCYSLIIIHSQKKQLTPLYFITSVTFLSISNRVG